jgi:nicotinamide-nucleotide amidase
MKATIVTIGDEILIGQIVDTNSGFIAKSLDKIGVEVNEMISISDNKQHIVDTFSKLQDQVDFVIITGGLGPTKDDITKKTFCDYFEDELVTDQKVLAHVEELFYKFTGARKPLLQVNIDQALVPSKATVLFNHYGTAPGLWMQKGTTVFMSLPGVPYEMKGLIENEIIPKIVLEYKRPYIIHKTILTYGVGESLLAETIADWEDHLPEFIKLAYLPSPGRVRLRLSARGIDKEILEKAIDENVKSLTKIIGDSIVGFDEGETIEVMLGKLLTQNKKTIATAESCTGGKIAQVLTSVPGASRYFKGSIVSYAKEVKIDVLGVSAETIKRHSVVSAEVASEMAANVRAILKTDYAIGVTGNAGPTSDDTNEEIGVVFIALATPDGVKVEKFEFGQPRQKVIDRTVNKSFEMLQKEILKNNVK